MTWPALDAVDDAVVITHRFLFPFRAIRWTKIALLVLLMSGSSYLFSPVSSSRVPIVPDRVIAVIRRTINYRSDESVVSIPTSTVGSLDQTATFGVIAGVLFVLFFISVARLSLRLVFYDALRTNTVRLWHPFRVRFRQAAGLFGFLLAVSAAAAIPVVVSGAVFGLAHVSIGWEPFESVTRDPAGVSPVTQLLFGVVGGTFVLLVLLVSRLTAEFVVPIMVSGNVGVLNGWRRLLQSLRGALFQLGAYLVVHFVIGVGIAIVEALAFVFVVSVVGIVASLVLLSVSILLGGVGTLLGTLAGIAAIGIVGAVSVISIALLVLPLRMLTRTYLISYEISTLQGVDHTVDLLYPGLDPAVSTADQA